MRVVLVEPNRIGRRLLVDLLEGQGYSVIAFADGLEAYNHINSGARADVLLTSLEVPGKCGLELCWDLCNQVSGKNRLHIIAMSSSREINTVAEALDSGADDFIRKPPMAEELYAKLRVASRLINLQEELQRLATRDGLTGLYSRRFFFERGQFVLDDMLCDTPVSVVMLDIDHFKSVNDTYGHEAGDKAICAVADLLIEGEGIAGRVGGEEFALVLPIFNDVEAAEYAEILRSKIAELVLEVDGKTFQITASFGISQWFSSDEDRIANVLRRADQSLYAAKEGGRNKVVKDTQDLCFVEADGTTVRI